LLSLHQKLVQDYGEAMVPPKPSQFLFRAHIADIPYIGCEYLMYDGIIERLRGLHEQLAQGAPTLAG
jgi:hypothetical protein